MSNKICIITLVLSAISFVFVGCTNTKESSKQPTESVTDSAIEHNTTELTTENEATTAVKIWKEQQVLSGAKRIDVGADMGNKLVMFHNIPSFCEWDDEFGGYIATNNDTNINGESFKVKITHESIDEALVYEDEKILFSSMIEDVKASCWTSDFQYLDQIQAFSYNYAIDETVQTEHGDMIHTTAVMELRRYNREHMTNNFTSLKFEVDILKPVELEETSVEGYIYSLYMSIIPGSNGESLK